MYAKKIFEKYREYLESESDLYGNKSPSFLFPIMTSLFGYLLEDNPHKTVTKFDVKIRKPMYELIQLLGPSFLPCKQVFENRKQLEKTLTLEEDRVISFPKEPVIWAPTHAYSEDILASFLAAKRSSYLLLGNPARLYNDIDGVLALLNGVVVVNRKNQKSRHSSIDKCKRVLELGSDLILFPEGVDNKTPNALVLHLFSGIYQIAKDKNVKIVPIIHYKEEDKNILHTVIDDPIDVSSMSREDALMTLRDCYSYWKYLMMEKYGKSTRKKEVGNDIDRYWEEKIKSQYKKRYDRESEIKAFYVTKKEREYYQALDDIANLEENVNNVLLVEDAKKLVKSQIQRRV